MLPDQIIFGSRSLRLGIIRAWLGIWTSLNFNFHLPYSPFVSGYGAPLRYDLLASGRAGTGTIRFYNLPGGLATAFWRNDKHEVNGSSRATELYDSAAGPFESFRKLPPPDRSFDGPSDRGLTFHPLSAQTFQSMFRFFAAPSSSCQLAGWFREEHPWWIMFPNTFCIFLRIVFPYIAWFLRYY